LSEDTYLERAAKLMGAKLIIDKDTHCLGCRHIIELHTSMTGCLGPWFQTCDCTNAPERLQATVPWVVVCQSCGKHHREDECNYGSYK
jgi:hypothetical protein